MMEREELNYGILYDLIYNESVANCENIRKQYPKRTDNLTHNSWITKCKLDNPDATENERYCKYGMETFL